MFAFLILQHAVQNAPPVFHVQIETDPSSKALQIVLSVAVALLSVATFAIGHRKRIQERRASWYHKVVIDPGLERLFDFFAEAGTKLDAAATECRRTTTAGRKTLSSKITAALAEYSEHLINVQNFIFERLVIFDEQDARRLAALFEQLQDDVSQWFETHVVKHRGNPEELRGIQFDAQRRIIRLLYDSEFHNF